MPNEPPIFPWAVDSGFRQEIRSQCDILRKAFDCVPHLRLLQKLDQLGIAGRLHSWIQSFLTKRTLRVKVGEGYSKFIDIKSGVPQGSVLGPVLFLMYINNCWNGLSCDAAMFADDVNIWRTIESSSDVQRLQNDIKQLSIRSQGASWASIQISVSSLGCILSRRRTITHSIN